MKKFVNLLLRYQVYPLSSSLFIILFLVVFLPFDISRSSTEAILIGVLTVGTTHAITLYLYRYVISKIGISISLRNELILLLPFFVLASVFSMALHIYMGMSTFSFQKAWEWLYGSLLVLPIPHIIMLFSLRKSALSPKRNLTFQGVALDRIFYLRAMGNYVELVYSDHSITKKKIIRTTMSSVEETLRFKFIRCHRSFIINPQQKHQLIGKSRNRRISFDLNGKFMEIPVAPNKYDMLVSHKG